jgi:hypothetical protein
MMRGRAGSHKRRDRRRRGWRRCDLVCCRSLSCAAEPRSKAACGREGGEQGGTAPASCRVPTEERSSAAQPPPLAPPRCRRSPFSQSPRRLPRAHAAHNTQSGQHQTHPARPGAQRACRRTRGATASREPARGRWKSRPSIKAAAPIPARRPPAGAMGQKRGRDDDDGVPVSSGPATIGQQTSGIRNKIVRSETYAKLKHKQKVRAGGRCTCVLPPLGAPRATT